MLEGPKKFSSGKVRWINIGHWVVDYFVIIWAGHIFFGSITLDIKEPTGMRMSMCVCHPLRKWKILFR